MVSIQCRGPAVSKEPIVGLHDLSLGAVDVSTLTDHPQKSTTTTYRSQRKLPHSLRSPFYQVVDVRLRLPAVLCQDVPVVELGFETEDLGVVDGHELQQVGRRAAEEGHAGEAGGDEGGFCPPVRDAEEDYCPRGGCHIL